MELQCQQWGRRSNVSENNYGKIRIMIIDRNIMTGATELLFTKPLLALYYIYPSVLLTKNFSEKMYSEKKEILIFQNIEKNFKKTDLLLQNMKKQHTTLR